MRDTDQINSRHSLFLNILSKIRNINCSRIIFRNSFPFSFGYSCFMHDYDLRNRPGGFNLSQNTLL